MTAIKQIHTVEEEVIVDVFCNCCGKSCRTSYGFEFVAVREHWGYGSHHDGLAARSDICEDCWFAFVASFKTPPEEV